MLVQMWNIKKNQTVLENSNDEGLSLYSRRKFCRNANKMFSQDGLDVIVTLKGINEDILCFRGSCINKTSAKEHVNSAGKDYFYYLAKMGFKTLIYSDGYNFRVSYNL